MQCFWCADGHRNAVALLGIKSKEFGSDGYNLLAFDDSYGQLGARLATTQAATALHLGHGIIKIAQKADWA